MPEGILLDNDVVIKLAAYSLAEQLFQATSTRSSQPAMLGVSRFVIASKIARAKFIRDRSAAAASVGILVSKIEWLEPDDAELKFAAQLEAEAMHSGLEMDVGESLLIAILINRSFVALITGDKRAIRALSKSLSRPSSQMVACLEQLVAYFVSTDDLQYLRTRICAEPLVDRAITACFGCSQATTTADSVIDGLRSYINDLEQNAPEILIPEEHFFSMLR